MTPEPVHEIAAIITGERGRREIVRPLEAVGVRCHVLDWEMLAGSHLGFISAAWRIIRAHRGVPVFTDMHSVFLAVILVIAKLHGARVLLRLRGDPRTEVRDQIAFHWWHREIGPLVRVLIAWAFDPVLFACIDRFVPVSRWIVQRLGIEARASVVRVPVPVENLSSRVHSNSAPVRILAVTNFNYPQKIEAMGRFLSEQGSWLREQGATCTVAGAGIAWEKFRIEHAAHADFPGHVSEIADLYSTHDIFVHFSGLDAFPYVVLEAMASGLPVIVNNDCGMLEQVVDGANGHIVDLHAPDAVRTKLRMLIESANSRAELGKAAREHVASTYSLERVGRDLLAVLQAT